jgi:hypothetical protein
MKEKVYRLLVAVPFVLFGVMLVMVLSRDDLLSWVLVILVGALALAGLYVYRNMPRSTRTNDESL